MKKQVITCRGKNSTYTRKAIIKSRPDGRRIAEVSRGNGLATGCAVTTYIEATDGLWDLTV